MRIAKRTLRLSALLALGAAGGPAQTVLPPTPPPSTTVFPLDEVRPGLQAVAYTVFQGVAPEPMAVEILGRLKNALGPGRDLILARLHGPKPEYTGVVAGMSGSPVYIDGKLLGAIGFRIGQFSKEPIAGITPIGQMLEVQQEATLPAPRTEVTPAGDALAAPDIRPMEEPLVFTGFGSEALARFGEGFRKLGLEPVSGLGSMDSTAQQTAPLEPGSAVSAVLVAGDLSITGTCTVSYLDKDRLMACGHPITQAGDISLPMAKAEVLATLASPLNSFKIVNATQIVGAFTEDRASAIFGLVGAQARMIPVHLALHGDSTNTTREIHLEVANHRELTPQLMLVSLFQSLQQVETASSDASYHLQGEIHLSRRAAGSTAASLLPSVRIDRWAAPSDFGSGAISAALSVGTDFTDLFANPLEQPIMTAVDLSVTVTPRRRTFEIESARLLTPELDPGGTFEVETVLHPYREPAQIVRQRFQLPASLPSGSLRLLISDGATLDRLTAAPSSHAVGLMDTVNRINAKHADNRVFVTLLDHNAQAVLDSTALTEVPLSLANVLDPLKTSQQLRLSGESLVELGSEALPGVVSGQQVLQLTVR